VRPVFSKVLIANRGEIAVRIMRTCRELGIETIAIYSDADERSTHVALADRAVRVGPAAPAESYLSIGTIIDAARSSGAEAVHPGYGFLSENSEFAAACAEAGLVFVGPPPDAIERMGSKVEARRLMEAAGVPVVPGEATEDQSDAALEAAVARVGFPALIKPSEGGGGIGMQVVRQQEDARAAIQSARREATGAFGDGTLYVERLIERPRHIEIQIFADDHGNVISLFERECSLQRRHQKIVEESPSPAVTPETRKEMGAAAVAAARAAGYRNAGTIEFLLEETPSGPRFYFLEMNTRLQVEHPVTEQVVGVDLVRGQLMVAAGQPLPWKAGQLRQRGHAIECRIYAEDPANEFLPQAGPLLLYREPSGPGVRVDSGVREGGTISVHYDPLIAKLIVLAESRATVLARLRRALVEFPILGMATNIPFLFRLVQHPAVRAGRIDTGFVEREIASLVERGATAVPEPVVIAALARTLRQETIGSNSTSETPRADPWGTLAGWRN
jgi:acetyl-CoA carboxylase biotin carboxylase subunit